MTKFVVTKRRKIKAQKINAILCDYLKSNYIEDKHILDIGCGNGEIISFFNNENITFGVDVLNQLDSRAKLSHYKIVESAKLPFPDSCFDIILSNHVIEHIKDQDIHLSEISRCLKQDGVCYFATPNSNYFIEPHHKVPFIHYFGSKLFHKILKILNKYEEDLYLLGYGEMKKLFKFHQFEFYEYTLDILKDPDKFFLEQRGVRWLPRWFLNAVVRIIPTNIFVLTKQ